MQRWWRRALSLPRCHSLLCRVAQRRKSCEGEQRKGCGQIAIPKTQVHKHNVKFPLNFSEQGRRGYEITAAKNLRTWVETLELGWPCVIVYCKHWTTPLKVFISANFWIFIADIYRIIRDLKPLPSNEICDKKILLISTRWGKYKKYHRSLISISQ